MALSAKKAASNKKWDAANLDRISIALPKGQRDTIKAAAAAAGKSVNAYIIDAINARMSGAPAPSAKIPEQQPQKSPAAPPPEQAARKSPEPPKPEPIRRPSLDELMALREQKLAEQLREEELSPKKDEQPQEAKPEPPREINYSPDAMPPELLERMIRAMDAQDRAANRKT